MKSVMITNIIIINPLLEIVYRSPLCITVNSFLFIFKILVNMDQYLNIVLNIINLGS